MASAIRTIGHEDRLSLVDHLEELRTRLIVSVAVLAVAFGICLWQNHALLRRASTNRCRQQTQKQVAKGEGTVGQAVLAQQRAAEPRHQTRRRPWAYSPNRAAVSPRTRARSSRR